MHVSPASEALTLYSQRMGLICLSIYSSNVFNFSKAPNRVLATRRYSVKTGDLAVTIQSVTALSRIVKA